MKKTNFNIKEDGERKIRRGRGRKSVEVFHDENETDDTPSKLGRYRKRPYDDITPPKSIVQQSDDDVKNNWEDFMKMMQNNNQLKESKYILIT